MISCSSARNEVRKRVQDSSAAFARHNAGLPHLARSISFFLAASSSRRHLFSFSVVVLQDVIRYDINRSSTRPFFLSVDQSTRSIHCSPTVRLPVDVFHFVFFILGGCPRHVLLPSCLDYVGSAYYDHYCPRHNTVSNSHSPACWFHSSTIIFSYLLYSCFIPSSFRGVDWGELGL